MMIATWRGHPERSGPSVAGAAFDIRQSLNRENFLFLSREQRIDLGNGAVGRLLHVVGESFLVILGNFVVLLQLLDDIEPVATDMADRDARSLSVFMCDLDQLLATVRIQFRDTKTKHLPFRRRRQTKI